VGENSGGPKINRRDIFIGGAAFAAAAPAEAAVVINPLRGRFQHTADVVIAGAGASGLAAAIAARDQGASVIVVEENYDIGGHAMLSGGRVNLGGGTSVQKKHGIEDSADQVFLDHTDFRNPMFRYSDRQLVRMWADENVATYDFLIENGVRFADAKPSSVYGAATPRLSITLVYSDNLKETINGRAGSGLARALDVSARKKGATILLRHKLTRLIVDAPEDGRVVGLVARHDGKDVNIRANKGVILCTGGHTSNVAFRRMFDPRMTEEYQTTGEPWTSQNADGELAAMSVGAALWATANQHTQFGITKTRHIGCRYGYANLKWKTDSPVFKDAKATGLTVLDWQNVILVNQVGNRVWNEMEDTPAFFDACMGTNGNLSKDANSGGGGPIWAIFDADAATREQWDPTPPQVDPDGWFFSANTVAELATRIRNPYQFKPLPPAALEASVDRYNAFVDAGKDDDFAKPTPKFKIMKPPFYAAWATPILHDSMTGLRINTQCQVLNMQSKVIPGLYAAGETAGGFSLHGLPRVVVFGRVAGREAARAKA